jgi:hypothetical protein
MVKFVQPRKDKVAAQLDEFRFQIQGNRDGSSEVEVRGAGSQKGK